MPEELRTPPMVRVYRTGSGTDSMFMEMARVDPGHYVAWSELRVMDRKSFQEQAKEFVEGSLRSFASRNGNAKRGRLKWKGPAPFKLKYDLVEICQVSASLLELVPLRRGELQYKTLAESTISIPTDSTPNDFAAALDEAFRRAAAK